VVRTVLRRSLSVGTPYVAPRAEPLPLHALLNYQAPISRKGDPESVAFLVLAERIYLALDIEQTGQSDGPPAIGEIAVADRPRRASAVGTKLTKPSL
jgi:hypothetical protein